jgi:hypothetical protein
MRVRTSGSDACAVLGPVAVFEEPVVRISREPSGRSMLSFADANPCEVVPKLRTPDCPEKQTSTASAALAVRSDWSSATGRPGSFAMASSRLACVVPSKDARVPEIITFGDSFESIPATPPALLEDRQQLSSDRCRLGHGRVQ